MDSTSGRGSALGRAWRVAWIPLLAGVAVSAACAIGRDDTSSAGGGTPTTSWTTGTGGGATTSTEGGSGGGVGGGSAGAGGTASGTTTTTSTTGGPYRHTIFIDGTNDFSYSDEQFETTTGSPFFAYFAWDEDYFYVGAEGPDIAGGSGAGQKWLLVYLGGANGTTTGTAYVSQQPELPFSARYHVQWCMSNTNTLASEWNGSAWSFLGWDFANDVYQNSSYVELRIPLADIGSPSTLDVHLSMLNETTGGEWTWSGVPSDSFLDAIDPDYGSYYSFDLGGDDVPSSYSPQY